MTDRRRRLVDQRRPRLQHAEEHLEIAAAVGRRPDVERRIEQPVGLEEAAAEGHVGAGPESPRAAVQLRRALPRLDVDAVNLSLKTAAEAAISLEQELRAGIELVGQ